MNETDELLSQLRDIQAPEVGLMPAPGWWLMIAALLLMAASAFFLYRRYQRRSWQREARATLDRLRKEAENSPVKQSLSEISTLVRRVALVARPRATVASLQGEAWLNELDDICGKPLFKTGFGKLLDQGPYQANPQLSNDDLNALMDVVAELIDAAGRSPMSKSPS